MQISEDQRTILLLVDVEERSYSEAARLLGIPAGTVMSRVSRARAALLAVINAGDETE
jgi:RNA polymerase sigma-70 factor (ECF subfamily)